MMILFVIYNSIYIPINIAFNVYKPLGQCILDLIIDLLFITDMLLNLRTTYYDDENELVVDKKAIYRKYLLSKWFVIDFLAVFPFDLMGGWTCGVPQAENSSASNQSLTIFKFLKVIRLLRLFRIRKELDRLEGANFLRVLLSLGLFLLAAHWISCIWFAVGYFEYYEDQRVYGTNDIVCDSSERCSWFRRVPGGGSSLSPDTAFGQQYLSSLYWSLTCVMKTPWIGPDTTLEKFVGLFAIVLGAIVHTYFLSIVQSSYSTYNRQTTLKRDKVSSLRGFMNHYNFPSELRARLLQHTYAHNAWIPTGLVNSNVLMLLPSNLRGNVALELYSNQCGGPESLFPKVSIECAKTLVSRLQMQLILPNQTLIAKGEVVTKLYFLLRGSLRVTAQAPAKDSSPPFASGETKSAQANPTNGANTRNSSRKSMMSAFREIEKPGAGIGLVEPKDRTRLGRYPVYVTSTKKSLLLAVSQSAISETLEGFPEDVPIMRDSLLKEHSAMIDSLRISLAPDAPSSVCEAKKTQDAEKKEIIVTEETTQRVAGLEAVVQNMLARVSGVQRDMKALPKILQLLQSKAGEEEVARLAASTT